MTCEIKLLLIYRCLNFSVYWVSGYDFKYFRENSTNCDNHIYQEANRSRFNILKIMQEIYNGTNSLSREMFYYSMATLWEDTVKLNLSFSVFFLPRLFFSSPLFLSLLSPNFYYSFTFSFSSVFLRRFYPFFFFCLFIFTFFLRFSFSPFFRSPFPFTSSFSRLSYIFPPFSISLSLSYSLPCFLFCFLPSLLVFFLLPLSFPYNHSSSVFIHSYLFLLLFLFHQPSILKFTAILNVLTITF